MKIVIFNLLIVLSFGLFANDCTLNLNGNELNRSALNSLKTKYNITNLKDARFSYNQGGQCMMGSCSVVVTVYEKDDYVYSSAVGEEDFSRTRSTLTYLSNGFFGKIGDRAIKTAVDQLDSCL